MPTINLNNIRSHGLSYEEILKAREWRIKKCGSPRIKALREEFGRYLKKVI